MKVLEAIEDDEDFLDQEDQFLASLPVAAQHLDTNDEDDAKEEALMHPSENGKGDRRKGNNDRETRTKEAERKAEARDDDCDTRIIHCDNRRNSKGRESTERRDSRIVGRGRKDRERGARFDDQRNPRRGRSETVNRNDHRNRDRASECRASFRSRSRSKSKERNPIWKDRGKDDSRSSRSRRRGEPDKDRRDGNRPQRPIRNRRSRNRERDPREDDQTAPHSRPKTETRRETGRWSERNDSRIIPSGTKTSLNLIVKLNHH